MKLYAPAEFWRMKREEPEELAMLVGGCGPGRLGDHIVPDRIPPIIGTKITESCAIHDYYYSPKTEATLKCKEEGDRVFLNNMLRQISEDKWFKRTKMAFVYLYYKMVKCFGGPAFWRGKNKLENEGEV